MRTKNPLAANVKRCLAVLLALVWAWSAGESALHALESQHVVCDEHGVVEDLATGSVHSHDAPVLSADSATPDDAHDACAHSEAVRDAHAIPLTATLTHVAPIPPLVQPRLLSPVTGSESPRGPPLLALAAKTSPPRLA